MTTRDELVLAQALTFAIEGLKTLPVEYRPESNIEDMQEMLAGLPKGIRNLADADVVRWLEHVFPDRL